MKNCLWKHWAPHRQPLFNVLFTDVAGECRGAAQCHDDGQWGNDWVDDEWRFVGQLPMCSVCVHEQTCASDKKIGDKKLLRAQLLCLNGRTLIRALSHSSTWPSEVGIFPMTPPGAVPLSQSSSALSCAQARSYLTGSIIEPLRAAKGDLSSLSVFLL